MYKLILMIVALALVWPLFAKAITLTPGPLTVSYEGDGSLFSETNLEPGDRISKDLTITNNGTINHNFAIATNNISGELASSITISAKEELNIIWTKTIAELENIDNTSFFITNLAPNQTKQITLIAEFPIDKDNQHANKNVNFNIVFGSEESEPTRGFLSAFSARPSSTPTVSPTPSNTISPTPTVTPAGEVKGESTDESSGLNPWLLLVVPAAVVLTAFLLPEFLIAGPMAAVTGGATYVLGFRSTGSMSSGLFYLLLIVEIIIFIVLTYFLLHHDNRASRKIKSHKHRFRLR